MLLLCQSVPILGIGIRMRATENKMRMNRQQNWIKFTLLDYCTTYLMGPVWVDGHVLQQEQKG